MIKVQRFTDDVDGRRQYAIEYVRIEPGRFAGIAREYDD